MITIERFDSRNTSVDATPSQQMSREAMIRAGISMSKETGTHAVIIHEKDNWEQYENGQRTEWSFPDGLAKL